MEEGKVSTAIIVALGVIVSLIMFQVIASYTSSSSSTSTFTNTTYTLSSTSNYTDIQGCQEVIGTYTIHNASVGSNGIPTSAVDLQEYVGTDGYKTVGFFRGSANYSGKNVNATFVCGNDGYVEDSGSKAVISLILIMTGLAIVVFTISPVLRDNLISSFR